MNYCKECGAELPDEAKFCMNCGAHNVVASAKKTPAPQAAPSFSATSDMKKKQPKKKNFGLIWLLISMAIVLLFTIGGFVFYKVMESQTGPEVAIKEWRVAVKNNDTEKIKDLLNESQSKTKATTEDAKSFIKLANEDSFLAKEMNELQMDAVKYEGSATIAVARSAEEVRWFSLEKAEKKAFFFDTYKVKVKPVDVYIHDYYDAELTLDGHKIKLDSDGILPAVLPGAHKLNVHYKSKYANLSKDFDLPLTQLKEGKVDMEVSLPANYLDFKTDTPDAHIVLDGKDTGVLATNSEDLSEIPTDGTSKVYLEKKVGKKVIRSKEVPIRDQTLDLRIDYEPLFKEGMSKKDKIVTFLKIYMAGFANVKTSAMNKNDHSSLDLYLEDHSPADKTMEKAVFNAHTDEQKLQLTSFKVDKIDTPTKKYLRVNTIEEYNSTIAGKKRKIKEKLSYYISEKDGILSIHEITPTK
ncbi:hypothetical protein A374_14290 [Fictibacillus macauensis ZFHKF-1]|uniref:Uncharacterized protein n=1 Tax=Fictibacillus macauensis ZFHKF-1 TaxID=1196324 RepID=I8UDH9_9BACL|nr:zinc-ribbon domain-containing protein [Fictibacillus macauensis]EIT84868.1 hypothetical protein A374_14290 [Fictibacillus macauensis ZFHKF-1]